MRVSQGWLPKKGSKDCITLRFDALYLEVRGISMARQTNPNFMNGIPELLILRQLAHREMYGYELVQQIQEHSNGEIVLSEGAVYPTLHSLESTGSIIARRKVVAGRSRIYYSITAAGSKRLTVMAKSWTNLTSAVQGLLGGVAHAAAI
jgi:PadR family transcriptional regulator, regulatory protein PadR